MGKPTGFIEFKRLSEASLPVADRRRNYHEFVLHLNDEQAKIQGARCMDCGIPFCISGCPVNNIIPDWNDLVYRGNWREALDVLHSTNNFPEFTGRICPAPCEAACTLNINNDAVGIKSIEHAIIDKGGENGWVVPQPAEKKTGKKVAIVGSGPAGLAAAQQLARAGYSVTVFEKNSRIGGLLRYGIPDFKLDKRLIDWRLAQMQAEGVEFQTSVFIGKDAPARNVANDAKKTISPDELLTKFDAVILSGGAEAPRDLPIPGRELKGVHFALEFLIPQNKEIAGDGRNPISAAGKHVVVIGGGDTGSDCVGTSNRHGALSVTQFEVMPRPPEHENKSLVWPNWPIKLRTSSSHEEGANRDWSVVTKEFTGSNGRVEKLHAVRVEWKDGKMHEIAGSEFGLKAAQKKFLDVVAEETDKMTGGKPGHPAKKMNKTEMSKLAREAAKSFVDAQKKLLDLAGHQMNVNLQAASRTMELMTPFRLIPIASLTGEGVKSFVDAEKALIDSMMKKGNGAKAKAGGHAKHPARHHKAPVAA